MAISRTFQMLASLAHRDFRLFWVGSIMSEAGRQVASVTLAWLVYDVTGSVLQLGLLAFARFVPSVVLGLVGGVAADKADRRWLLVTTALGAATIYAVLGALALTGAVQVWHVLIIAVLASALGSFGGPSRQAIFPHLVDRQDLTNAVALTATINPGVRIFTPLIAGLMIDRVGTGYVGAATVLFWISGMYLVSSYLLFAVRMPHIPRAVGGGLQTLLDGLRYVRANHVLAFLIGMAFVLAFFGMTYTTLLPVFAASFSPESSGLALGGLFSAAGIGGIIGALVTGFLRSVSRPGFVVAAAGAAFGAILVAFAYAPGYGLALALLLLATMAHSIFSVTAMSVVHRTVPDDYRGRVMGLWGMQFTVLHTLGGLAMGALAAGLGAPVAMAIGGGAVAAFGIFVAGSNRRIRNLQGESVQAPDSRRAPTAAD